MGNTVVWKAAETQIYSASLIMEILEEAGLPKGVINLIFVDGAVAGDVIFNHKDFAGIHFTGSTGVFRNIWQTIGNNLSKYKSLPRLVGRLVAKILSLHIILLTQKLLLLHYHVALLNFKVRNAVLHSEHTFPNLCGRK